MLYVVGMGSGKYEHMTIEAKNVLESVDLIVGYKVYADIVREFLPNQNYFDTAMTKEVDRCQYAIDEAKSGKNVAVVSSGDSVVYGMASLVLELAEKSNFSDVKIVSGVSACITGSGVLGSVISNDFCVVSLSDLLTPWEKIEKRLMGAGVGDFCVAIYNPSSIKRHDYLMKACDILLEYKSKDTICGTVRNIGRSGEEANIMTLETLRNTKVDMFTTVFIGNSETKVIDGRMVTVRGYNGKKF